LADIVLARDDGWNGRDIALSTSPQVVDLGRPVDFFRIKNPASSGGEVFISKDREVVADADKYPSADEGEDYVYENRKPGESGVRVLTLIAAAGTPTVRLEL